MVDQRLRRWPNIKPALAQRFAFARDLPSPVIYTPSPLSAARDLKYNDPPTRIRVSVGTARSNCDPAPWADCEITMTIVSWISSCCGAMPSHKRKTNARVHLGVIQASRLLKDTCHLLLVRPRVYWLRGELNFSHVLKLSDQVQKRYIGEYIIEHQHYLVKTPFVYVLVSFCKHYLERRPLKESTLREIPPFLSLNQLRTSHKYCLCILAMFTMLCNDLKHVNRPSLAVLTFPVLKCVAR